MSSAAEYPLPISGVADVRPMDEAGHPAERRKDVTGGTDLMKSLPTAAAAGAAAGSAVVRGMHEYGSMGMSGVSKMIGNATAMMLVGGLLIFMYRDYTGTMKADREYERNERQRDRDERQRDRDERQRDRDVSNAEIRALASEIRADRETSRALISEFRGVVTEFRNLGTTIRTIIPKKDKEE